MKRKYLTNLKMICTQHWFNRLCAGQFGGFHRRLVSFTGGFEAGVVCLFLTLLLEPNCRAQSGTSPNEAWSLALTNLQGGLMAIDHANRVIVAGTKSTNIVIDEFGDHGIMLWSGTSAGPFGGGQSLQAVCVDGSNNVIVAGASAAMSGTAELALLKFSASGTQEWGRTFPGPQASQSTNATLVTLGSAGLATDASGNIYAAGTFTLNATNTVVVAKWDSAGKFLWNETYFDTNSTGSTPAGLTVDSAGNSFVLVANSTSRELGVPGLLVDQTLLAYDPTGHPLWQFFESNTVPSFVLVDAQTNVYTAGQHAFPAPAGNNLSFTSALMKVGPGGAPLWQVEYNDNPQSSFFVDGIPIGFALDNGGNVYLCSEWIDDAPRSQPDTLFVYSPDGKLVMNQTFPSIKYTFSALAVAGGGRSFVAFVNDTVEPVLVELDPAGNQINNHVFTGQNVQSIRSLSLLCDSFGNVVSLWSHSDGTCGLEKEVFVAPQWTLQPAGAIVPGGTNLTLNAQATGAELNAQWSLNGQLLSGATNLNLSLSSVASNQAGAYRVTVGNPAGAISSWTHLVVDGWSPSYLVDVTPTGGGGLQFTSYGIPNAAYTIVGSSNFVDWLEIGRFTNDITGRLTVAPPTSRSGNSEAYRVRLGP